MEFIWLMECHIPFLKHGKCLAGGYPDLSFVYADELPKIVGFPLKGEVAHIFKVVYAVYLAYGY